MNDPEDSTQPKSPAKQAQAAARRRRLAGEMRANLVRRKAPAKAVSGETSEDDTTATGGAPPSR